MKIDHLHIDGFGTFHDKKISGFSEGVTVLYGENEAGKSTLLDFIRFTLFGYPRLKDERRSPVYGGKHGGSISLINSANEAVTVYREGKNHQFHFDYKGKTTSKEHEYQQLMGNASSDLYQNVYAITLDELISIGKLSDSGMEDRIFSLGMGLSGVDFGGFEKELVTHSKEYYLSGGKKQILLELTNQIEEREGKIADLRRKMDDYNRLTELLKQLESECTELAEQRKTTILNANRLTALERAYPHFVEYVSAKKIISGRDSFTLHPQQIREDYLAYKAEFNAAQKLITQFTAESEDLKRELAALKTNENLDKNAHVLDYFKSTLELYRQATIEIEQEKAKIVATKRQIDSVLSQLGESVQPDILIGIQGTLELRNTSVEIYDQQHTLAQKLDRTEEQLLQYQSTRADLTRQQEEVDTEIRQTGINSPAEAEEVERERIETDTLFQKALSGSTAPTSGKESFLPGIIAVGCILIASGFLLLYNTLLGGTLLLIAGLLLFFIFRNTAKSKTVAPVQDGNQMNRRLKELENKLQNYRTLSAKRKELQRQIEELSRQQKSEENKKESILSESENLQKEWEQLLREKQLPLTLTPRSMESFLSGADELKKQYQRIKEAEDTLLRLTKTKEDFEEKLRIVLPENELPNYNTALILIQQLEENASIRLRHDQLQENLQKTEKSIHQKQEETLQLQEKIDQLFELTGVSSEQEFYARFEKQEIYQKAEEQLQTTSKAIQSICGQDNFEQTLEALTQTNPSDLQIATIEAKELAETTEKTYEEKNRELAECKTEIRHILEPDEMYALLNEREALQTRLDDAAKEWLTTKIALRVLSDSKQKYETEKQPEVITYTRDYFREITANTYEDLRISLSEKHVSLIDNSGKTKTVEQLSRGTREQLLLALRMGLIEEYEKSSEPLPVVLDDVMVNFDVHRSANLAKALNRFGIGRQVILFTCHEHTRDLFAENDATIITW